VGRTVLGPRRIDNVFPLLRNREPVKMVSQCMKSHPNLSFLHRQGVSGHDELRRARTQNLTEELDTAAR
jgi:hypothetical protein